jgi:hypothetical protein
LVEIVNSLFATLGARATRRGGGLELGAAAEARPCALQAISLRARQRLGGPDGRIADSLEAALARAAAGAEHELSRAPSSPEPAHGMAALCEILRFLCELAAPASSEAMDGSGSDGTSTHLRVRASRALAPRRRARARVAPAETRAPATLLPSRPDPGRLNSVRALRLGDQVVGLNLLRTALQAAGDGLARSPPLASLVQKQLARALAQLAAAPATSEYAEEERTAVVSLALQCTALLLVELGSEFNPQVARARAAARAGLPVSCAARGARLVLF